MNIYNPLKYDPVSIVCAAVGRCCWLALKQSGHGESNHVKSVDGLTAVAARNVHVSWAASRPRQLAHH